MIFHLYGVIISLGVLAGFLLAKRQAKIYKISSGEIENIYLLLIPSCVIGSRAYHVLHQWEFYSKNSKEIFVLRQGGLGIYGAIIAGLITLWAYAKIKKISPLVLLDLLSPSIALAQAIGRSANFFNQEAFGPPTNLPWKIYVSPENRPSFWHQDYYFHPLFLYESVFMFFSFLALLFLSSRFPRKRGLVTGVYFLSYGVIRFLTEFGRFDTWQIDGLKVAQVLSLILIIAGITLISPSPNHRFHFPLRLFQKFF